MVIFSGEILMGVSFLDWFILNLVAKNCTIIDGAGSFGSWLFLLVGKEL